MRCSVNSPKRQTGGLLLHGQLVAVGRICHLTALFKIVVTPDHFYTQAGLK